MDHPSLLRENFCPITGTFNQSCFHAAVFGYRETVLHIRLVAVLAFACSLSVGLALTCADPAQAQMKPLAETTDAQIKAEFFTKVKEQKYSAAVTEGRAYLARHPGDDEFALDLAYAEISAGESADAQQLLRHLGSVTNSTVASKARAQLAAMAPGGPSATYAYPPGYLYSYAENDSRFGDIFVGASARYDLGRGRIRPYASLAFSDDSRSGAPPIAQIYSTDAISPAIGVRMPFGHAQYGYAFAQGEYAIGLRGQRSLWATQYGIAYSRDYGSLLSERPHTQIGGSAIVYSRFGGNGIAYLQASYDAKVAGPIRAIVGTNVGLDARRLYYNNFAEAYGGLVAPLSRSLSLRVVGVAGRYLGRGVNIPAAAAYTSVRTLLVYGIDFGHTPTSAAPLPKASPGT